MIRLALCAFVCLGLGACSAGSSPRQREAREGSAPSVPSDAGSRPSVSPAQDPAPSPVTSAPSPPVPPPTRTVPAIVGNPLDAMRNIHDPALIREGEWYYVFSTGAGVPIHRSRDLVHWEPAGRVFRLDVPDWAKREVPGSAIVWAPDIALVDGRYVLTYSVGTFGQNRSVIGMASTPTLDPTRRDYNWRHDGKVVESVVGDDHNAIDSNLFLGLDGRAWLSWGSYWRGIKLVELDRATLKPHAGAPVESIAQRETSGGIEAPFIIQRNGWYYLFLSFDKCCSGVNSTYNIRVGRSRSINGPYYDRLNKPMSRGGGTRILETTGRIIGPGHCAVYDDAGRWLLVHHYYDAEADGIPTLQVRELLWDNLGWPRAGSVIAGL